MSRLVPFLKRHIYILIVATVLLVVFRVWFFKDTILTDGDWYYYTTNSLLAFRLNYFHLWLGDQNFGRPILDVAQAPTYALYGVLAKLGINYAVSERLIHMIFSVVIAPISSYFYLRLFTSNKWAIAAGTTVYCCNTYFLQLLTGDITLAAAYAVAPLVLQYFILNFRSASLKNASLAAIFSFVMISYEPRIFLILAIAILIYTVGVVFSKRFKAIVKDYKTLSLVSLPFILIILVSFFWLIGLYKIGGDVSGSILSRNLFGSIFYKLENSLTINQPFWTGNAPVSFIYHRIGLNQWVIPVFAILGIYFAKTRKPMYYFAVLACIGIFLGKQISEPFTHVYPWLYFNVPGFNAYREASKFYVLTALGYSGLTTLLIVKLFDSKMSHYLKVLIALVPIIFIAINLKPFFINTIGTTNVARHIPNAYVDWNNYISKQPNFSRSLWLPDISRWADNTKLHPEVSAVSLSQNSWKDFTPDVLSSSGADSIPLENQISNIYTKAYIDKLISDSSIQYIVIPVRDTQNDDDFFQNYGNDRNYFINTISQIAQLKKTSIGKDGLIVYENQNFKPYITSSRAISKFNSSDDINDDYAFKQDGLKDSTLNFTTTDTNKPTEGINDISTSLGSHNLQNGQLSIMSTLPSNTINRLYSNTSELSYSYTIKNSVMRFTQNNANDLVANGSDIGAPISSVINSSVGIIPTNAYELAQGDMLHTTNILSPNERTIGATNDSLSLYSSPVNENFVQNGSFENGLWQSKVDDCNDYGSGSAISMKQDDSLSTIGHYSLELAADKHTACTSSAPIDVTAGQTMSLAYDYQIKGGQRAGYDLVFNDSKHTVLNADQIKGSGRWYNLYTKFVVPSGATQVQVRLKGYPDDNNKQHAKTFYDNVVVQPLTLVSQIAPATTPTYVKTPLTGSTLSAKIVNSSFTYKNLIVNPSLEQGLWQKKVGDCNAYDDKPLIAQSLNKQSKTDGKQSLELDATRHIACTGPASVAVKEGQSYLLSFDYKSPTESQAGYYVSFDDPSGTVISEQLPITDHNWHTFTKTFVVPFGATHISLNVYSYADQYGGIKEVNLYDNFYLTQIPTIQNRYYVVSTPKVTLKQPQHISYQLSSPTKKYVQVTGASTPFYLNMSESYHPQWRLELDDAKSSGGLASWSPKAHPTAVPDVDHFDYDDFLNSWYVDPAKLCAAGSTACHKNADGSYDLKLIAEFAPQRYFYVGLIISGVTLLGCFGYLGRYYYQRRAYTRGVKRSAEHVGKK